MPGESKIEDDGLVRIAVLDDYQDVARGLADWGSLPDDAQVIVFNDHVAEEEEVVARLHGFEVVVAMRERTPFPRSVLARLPALKLLVTTGMRNAAIDLEEPHPCRWRRLKHGAANGGTGMRTIQLEEAVALIPGRNS